MAELVRGRARGRVLDWVGRRAEVRMVARPDVVVAAVVAVGIGARARLVPDVEARPERFAVHDFELEADAGLLEPDAVDLGQEGGEVGIAELATRGMNACRDAEDRREGGR